MAQRVTDDDFSRMLNATLIQSHLAIVAIRSFSSIVWSIATEAQRTIVRLPDEPADVRDRVKEHK